MLDGIDCSDVEPEDGEIWQTLQANSNGELRREVNLNSGLAENPELNYGKNAG